MAAAYSLALATRENEAAIVERVASAAAFRLELLKREGQAVVARRAAMQTVLDLYLRPKSAGAAVDEAVFTGSPPDATALTVSSPGVVA